MMLRVALVFACAITITLASNEWKEKILKQEKQCQEDPKTRLSEAFLEKLRKGEITDDPNLGAHCICMATNLGLMDSNGKISTGELMSVLASFIRDEGELKEAYDRCNSETDSPEKTALGLWRCTTKASRPYWDESDDWKERILKQEKKCQEDPNTRLSEAFLVKLRKGEITSDPNLGAHCICMATNLGLMDSSGKIRTSVLRSVLASFIKDTAEFKEAYGRCNSETDSPEKTAMGLWRCTTKASRPYWDASNDWKGKILKQEKQCQEDPKTRLSDAFLEKLRKGEITYDPNLGAHCICMATNLGLMDSNGKISTSVLRSVLATFIKNRGELERAFTRCNSEKENPEKTALGLWRCTTESSRPYWDGPNGWKVKILRQEKLCQENPKTRLSEEFLEKLRKGEITNDPNLGAHCICMATNLGLMDFNGKISTSELRSVLTSFIKDNTELERAFTRCNSEKENPEKTALGLWRCTTENSRPYWDGPNAWKEKILRQENLCQEDPKTRLSEEFLEKLRKGKITYDPNLGAHCICMATNLGLMDSNGEISTSELRSVLTSFIKDSAELERAFARCNSRKENPEKTALGLWRCTTESSRPYWDGPNGWKVKILRQERLCQENPKTRLSEEFLEKLRKGEITNDPNLGAHCICMATNLGLMNSNGEISTSELRNVLTSFIRDSAELERAFTRCNSEKENPEKTALGLWRCTTETSRPYWDGPNAWKVKILRQEKLCQEDPKTRLSEEFLEKLRKGEITYDPNLGAHCTCMATNLGLMDSNGKISTSVLRSVLTSFIKDSAELERAFTRCNSEKENPEKTALGLWRCTTETSRPYWNGPNSWKVKILRQEKLCQEDPKTRLSGEFLEKLRKGEITYDPNLGAHCICMATNLGLMDSNGKIGTIELRSVLTSFIKDSAELERAFTRCNSEKESPEKTALGLWRCTTETSRPYWDGPNEWKVKILRQEKLCQEDPKTRLSEEFLEKLRKGEITNDPNLGAHCICMATNLGLMDSNGKIGTIELRSVLTSFIKDSAELERAFTRCNSEKENPEKTALGLWRCTTESSRPYWDGPNEWKVKILRQEKLCQEDPKTRLSEEFLEKLRKGEITNDPNLGAHCICMATNLGLMDSNGKIGTIELRSVLTSFIKNSAELERAFTRCNSEKENPEKTALGLWRCTTESSRPYWDGPNEWKVKILRQEKLCQEDPKTRLSEEFLEKLRKGEIANDPNLGAHCICMATNLGLMDSNGKIGTIELRSVLTSFIKNSAELERAFTRCNSEKENPEKTALGLWRCTTETSRPYWDGPNEWKVKILRQEKLCQEDPKTRLSEEFLEKLRKGEITNDPNLGAHCICMATNLGLMDSNGKIGTIELRSVLTSFIKNSAELERAFTRCNSEKENPEKTALGLWRCTTESSRPYWDGPNEWKVKILRQEKLCQEDPKTRLSEEFLEKLRKGEITNDPNLGAHCICMATNLGLMDSNGKIGTIELRSVLTSFIKNSAELERAFTRCNSEKENPEKTALGLWRCTTESSRPYWDGPNEWKVKILRQEKLCQEDPKTRLSEEFLEKLRKGEITNDPNLGAHCICMATNLGLMDSNGKIGTIELRSVLTSFIKDSAELERAFTRCNSEKENPENTALGLWRCTTESSRPYWDGPNEWKVKILRQEKLCQEDPKTRLSEEFLEKLRKGEITNDPNLGAHCICMATNLGLMDSNGKIGTIELRSVLTSFIKNSAELERAFTRCNSEKENPEKTALGLWRCTTESSRPYWDGPNGWKVKILRQEKLCQEDPKTRLSEEFLEKLRKGEITNDPNLGAHCICMATNLGLMDYNGKIGTIELRSVLTSFIKDSAELERAFTRCNSEKGNPEKTALGLWRCTTETSRPYWDGSNEWKVKILRQEKLCQEDPKTRLSEEFLEKLRKGEITNDPNLGAHCICMATNLGLMDTNGKISTSELRSVLASFIKNSGELERAITRCNSEKENPENTALGLWRCTTETSRPYWDGPNGWKVKILRQEKLCQENPKTKLSEVFLEKLRKGEVTEDPNLGAHCICMATNLGMMDSNGKISTSELRNVLASFIKDSDELKEAYDRCYSEKETPEKTALGLWRCTTEASRRYWA